MRILLVVAVVLALQAACEACNRIPFGITASKSPVDDGFAIMLPGNPEKYAPGQKYNISIVAYSGLTFIGFMLGIETESGDNDMEKVGAFEVFDFADTRFSPRCPNLIENTNTNVKSKVEVTWIAPITSGNGCILLKATVIQHRDVWFMDDGLLTKKICEEEIDDIDSQPAIMEPCCACDEAKYELTFEGKWSRHTHPKDFPANSWSTRFSDIIGASHTIDYRFWQYGELASEGLKEVAEHGSTRALESELKAQSDQIRTIIKARGIAYPNVTGKTFAVFRVDKKHHLISLVSMIDPSPDWIVGVSGLELCLPNCTWIENKIHNLYPWDAGTDSGPSYMSADQPQIPPDVVRRIKSNHPNDPRSPFYDPDGTPMKPLATLHINRRRLYEKTCENTDLESDRPECSTTSWSRYTECSSACKQYRTREFRNPSLANRAKCREVLREEQSCFGKKCPSRGFNEEEADNIEAQNANPIEEQHNAECALSDFGNWSSCSVSCGSGIRVRSRHYLNRKAKRKCERVAKIPLKETEECEGLDCGGDIENGIDQDNNVNGLDTDSDAINGAKSLYMDDEARYRNFESYSQKREDYIPPECGVSDWSEWSPCIGPCGAQGQRVRERKIWNYNEVYGLNISSRDGRDPCRHIKVSETINCTNPSCDTIVPSLCYESLKASHCRDSDVNNYWFYDHMSNQCSIFWADKCDKNRNKFPSKEICEETCLQPRHKMELENIMGKKPIDCLVSEFRNHPCNATCGEGVRIRTRRVLKSPKYGGKPCPKHLVHIEKCYQRCEEIYSIGSEFEDRRILSHPYIKPSIEKNDCRYSEWSAWTPCTASCGDSSVRQKTRTLLNPELNYKCKDRLRMERCHVLPCQLESNDDEDKW